MSGFGPFVLGGHPNARPNALRAVSEAPDGLVVVIREKTRSLEANAKLHATLADIAEQLPWYGKMLSVDVWKRLCTAAWLREIGESPEMVPALDKKGFDVIFERTSQLSVKQMSSLIEWCLAFGAQNGVKFNAEA